MWDKIVGQLPVVSRRKTVQLNEQNTKAITARNKKYMEIMIARQNKIHELKEEIYYLTQSYNKANANAQAWYQLNFELEEELAQAKIQYIAVSKPRTFWQRLVYLFQG